MTDKSNLELISFLNQCDDEIFLSLLESVETLLSIKIGSELKDLKKRKVIPPKMSPDRYELSFKFANHLRYYGSNNIAYFCRKAVSIESGVNYKKIVYDVTKKLTKMLKIKKYVKRIATVEEYEYLICEMLLLKAIKGKTQKELAELLRDSGLDEYTIQQAAIELSKGGLNDENLIVIIKDLGKKTITTILNKLTIWFVAKRIGKEAAEVIAKRILIKLPQKGIAKIFSGIGWGLLVWDTIQLASPATRITIPVVSLIACVRTAERIANS